MSSNDKPTDNGSRTFRAPKGTADILPPHSGRWQNLLGIFAGLTRNFGYSMIQSPMFEDIGVFQRLGDGTDVVTKEMYDFTDKGGRQLALRPEGTASVARAFAEHNPTARPWKVWYATPAFRYERPQAGRLRQHHQVGIEAIGSHDPDLDVEVIALGNAFLRSLGLTQFTLRLNFMGTPADRAQYATVLQRWLRTKTDDLAAEDAAKIDSHPLRVLDSKRDATRTVLAQAPRISEVLGQDSARHATRVQTGLAAIGIDFDLDANLVRGLDYYTHTLFEFVSSSLGNAQSTLLGGGRYDGLIEQLGGKPTGGVGFGCGIERVLLTCDAEGVFPGNEQNLDVYVIDTTGGHAATTWADRLRRAGLRVDRGYDNRSMRSQMKSAAASNARYALIIGEREATDRTVTVRNLLTSEQVTIAGDADQVTNAIR